MAIVRPNSAQSYSNAGATFGGAGNNSYTKEKRVEIVDPDYSDRFDDYDYYWRQVPPSTSGFSSGFSDGFE